VAYVKCYYSHKIFLIAFFVFYFVFNGAIFTNSVRGFVFGEKFTTLGTSAKGRFVFHKIILINIISSIGD